MRITNIEMKNYRQYKDANISFEKNSKNDMHLFIAKNGSGKSNFLNAINWCLYDEEPHLSEKNTALPVINTERLKQMKFEEHKNIKVEITVENKNNTWLITREKDVIKVDNEEEPIIEHKNILKMTEMDKNGNIRQIKKEEEINETIKLMFPKGLRAYFFFDNEQLNNYFNENKAESIKGSIYTISQISELKRIEERLGKVKRKFEEHLGKDNEDIDEENKKLDRLEKELEDKKQEIDIIEKEIRKSEEILDKANLYLNNMDDIRELQRQQSEKEELLKKEEDDFENSIKEMQRFIVRYEVLIRLYPELNELKNMLEDETRESGEDVLAYVNNELVEKILKSKRCIICNRDIDSGVEERLKDILKELNNKNSSIADLERIKKVADNLIKETKSYKHLREKLLSNIKRIDDRKNSFIKDIEYIKSKIGEFANEEEAKNWFEKKEKHKKLRENNRMKKSRYDSEKEILERKIEISKGNINKLIEQDKVNKEFRIKVHRTKEMQDIITNIKEELITEIKDKVEKETFDNFNRLIWKRSTYKRVEIDDSYNVKLINKDDLNAIGSCSAAETSLLALSFTLALHSISGFDAPLVIDSPVGRISDENRENFTKVLFGVSENKQIILLFSPSEYSEEVQSIIENNYSTKRSIIVTDDEREVTVK